MISIDLKEYITKMYLRFIILKFTMRLIPFMPEQLIININCKFCRYLMEIAPATYCTTALGSQDPKYLTICCQLIVEKCKFASLRMLAKMEGAFPLYSLLTVPHCNLAKVIYQKYHLKHTYIFLSISDIFVKYQWFWLCYRSYGHH